MVFHKGGENSYFISQLIFGLPLFSTPILYDEKWFKGKLIWILIWYHMKNTYNWYQDAYLFTFYWYQDAWFLIVYLQKGGEVFCCFYTSLIVFVLLITRIFIYWLSFNWYHDSLILIFFFGRICFIAYLDPFVDDWQKGGEVFKFICIFIQEHSLVSLIFLLVSRALFQNMFM